MIIQSILDTDFYKLSIQQFIWTLYPDVEVEYAFNNRDKSMTFTQDAFNALVDEINNLPELELTIKEYRWLKSQNLFSHEYLEYLSDYKFDTDQIEINLLFDGHLDLRIKGRWVDTVLWEVPLMALISEIYFKYVDSDWNGNLAEQEKLAKVKASNLSRCIFTDFGTRRRRDVVTQDIVVGTMKKYTGFNGTSNPYLAMKHGVKAVGTMAHEVICAISSLESMNHPNKITMEKWREVYGEKLSIFLPDTYGVDSFLKDFDEAKTARWAGVRHDSGCPFEFTNKILAHYKDSFKNTGWVSLDKTIVFSDSLDVSKAIELAKYCDGKIQCMFGIGTHFTNDYKKRDGTKSKPMNMVIKLVKCNGQNVCKLSQNPEKAMGDPEAIRIMRHLHFGAPL
jgi:nicotinate phosphoribosyltransferase